MRLLLVGINHRTAPVELRERVDFQTGGIERALHELAGRGVAHEAVVLSTCNRAEMYAACEDVAAARADLVSFISQFHGVGHEDLRRTSTTRPTSTSPGISSASPPASTRSSSASRRFSDR